MAKKDEAVKLGAMNQCVDPWRAEEDARTLQRAQEVQADKKRHGAAIGHAKKQVEALQKITKPAAKPAPKAQAKKSGGKKK